MPSHSRYEKPHDVDGTSALLADFNSPLAVVITHPWGPLGGNVHNNIVNAVALYFQELKVTTMRIGFKGSQLGRGNSEVEEVRTAANYLLDGRHRKTAGDGDDDGGGAGGGNDESAMMMGAVTAGTDNKSYPSCVLLVGYSYGALIAASASAGIRQCIGYAAIAPPFGVQHWLLLFNSSYHTERAKVRRFPRLLMQGSKDNFTSEKKFALAVESFPKGTTGAVLKNADHHFLGREGDVMNIVAQWLVRAFPALEGELSNLPTTDLWATSMLKESMSDDNSIGAQSFVSSQYPSTEGGAGGGGTLAFMNRFYECADLNACRSTQI